MALILTQEFVEGQCASAEKKKYLVTKLKLARLTDEVTEKR